MNNISFQGRTDFFISPTAYRKVENVTRSACGNLNKSSNRVLVNGKTYALSTSPEHLTVILKNKNKGFLEFVPLNADDFDSLRRIATYVTELKRNAKKENLTAWIVGGTKLKESMGEKITLTLNKVADLLCDRPDIDTSILIGSKTGEETFVMHSVLNRLELGLDKKVNPKNNLIQELENNFDVVELNNTNLSYMA